MLTENPPIQVSQKFNKTPSEIWKVITELNHLQGWFFANIPAFKPEVGFQTEFLVENEGRQFTHLWKITKVEVNKSITYSWRYTEHTGDSFVHFNILEDDDAYMLTVSTEVTEDFPTNIPEFNRESCIAGWNYFIKESLVNYMSSI